MYQIFIKDLYKMRNLEIRTYKTHKIEVDDPGAEWCYCEQTRTVYLVGGHKVWKQCLEDSQDRELLTE